MHFAFVLPFALVAAVSGAVVPATGSQPAVTSSQFHSQDEVFIIFIFFTVIIIIIIITFTSSQFHSQDEVIITVILVVIVTIVIMQAGNFAFGYANPTSQREESGNVETGVVR